MPEKHFWPKRYIINLKMKLPFWGPYIKKRAFVRAIHKTKGCLTIGVKLKWQKEITQAENNTQLLGIFYSHKELHALQAMDWAVLTNGSEKQ